MMNLKINIQIQSMILLKKIIVNKDYLEIGNNIFVEIDLNKYYKCNHIPNRIEIKKSVSNN